MENDKLIAKFKLIKNEMLAYEILFIKSNRGDYSVYNFYGYTKKYHEKDVERSIEIQNESKCYERVI